MSLLNCITSNAAAMAAVANQDWPAAAAALTESSIAHTVTTLRNSRWLMIQLNTIVDPNTGMTEADVLIATLESSPIPRAREALRLLSGEGLDLSHPDVQAMLPIIGSQWPAGLVEKIGRFGVWHTAPWQESGLLAVPTSNEIHGTWSAHVMRESLEASVDQAYQTFVARYNTAKIGIVDGTLTTLEEVESVLAGE